MMTARAGGQISRVPRFMALGGLLGAALALPLAWSMPLMGIGLLIASIGAWLGAGQLAIRRTPAVAQTPPPDGSLRLAAEVGVDELVLALVGFTIPVLAGRNFTRVGHEINEARALFQQQGWLADPATYHPAPPAVEAPMLRRRRSVGIDFEHLSFASDYAPWPDEPGRDRWLGYAPNRTAHAWIVRQRDSGRPWLICIHGHQMGIPRADLLAYRAAWLHRRLGLNLAFPILPFHGPRQVGRWNGEGFLAGDFLDTLHAEAQALWDMRRLLTWLHGQGAERIGVYGLSLGGYNGALLASLEDDLAVIIAGIPASDLTDLIHHHSALSHLRRAATEGLRLSTAQEIMRVVSPLALTPRLPHARRAIFGAVADRLVPSYQVQALWRHWECPDHRWYQGGHLSFAWHREVSSFVEDRLRQAGLIEPFAQDGTERAGDRPVGTNGRS